METTTQPTGKKTVAGTILHFSLLILFWITDISPVLSQQIKGKVSGKVTTSTGEPLPFASIALLDQEGKALKGTLTDTTGQFNFSTLTTGKYRVKITTMGFLSHQSEIFDLSAQSSSINLGRLSLHEDARQLNAVTIKAQKQLIEQGIDRTVMNIEQSILAEGNTALELLEKAPGVKVGEDGQISIKGRPGVTVMVNGKSTYLSPKELANLLKSTNSSSISAIEIMSNPSAKYDAAGNAGIINIRMKKNTASGFNGSLSANGGAGRNARYGSGLNLNYRNTKLNVYGSYNYAYRGETEYLNFTRRFYDNGIANGRPDRSAFQDTQTDEPLHTNNFRFGIDYELNNRNSIGFLVNGNVGRYTHDSQTGNILKEPSGTLLSHMVTSNYDLQSWKNLSYNLNYLHKFEKEGREFSADADFAGNSFTSKLNLNTTTLAAAAGQPASNITRKGYVPAVTDVYLAKIDYTDPLSKTLKLESGLKSSFIQSDNNLRYELLNGNTWTYDANGSNHFRYKEQIHAGYLNFNKTFKGFSVQAGLRGEYTHTEGHQITTDSLLKRSYFQLFPSVFINKPFGEKHQVQLAYSKRIERPDYGDLNPFRVFRDPLLYYQGNPFLKPELINTFQLAHTFKNRYTTTLSYNQTTDVITWITGQIDAINTTFEMPRNLSKLVNYGISFSASTSFFHFWSGTHFANLFRNEYEGEGQHGNFNNEVTSYSFNSQNSFKMGKGYTAELSGYYYSGSVYGISSYKANWALSSGIQKNIWNDKGSIKLLINDIFQSNKYREQTLFQNIDMSTYKSLDSRRAMLSFTWRFGNQNPGKKQRKTGSEDILNRVKGGN